MGFVSWTIAKMAAKTAVYDQIAFVETPTKSFNTGFFQISYMDFFHQIIIHIWIWVLSDEHNLDRPQSWYALFTIARSFMRGP